MTFSIQMTLSILSTAILILVIEYFDSVQFAFPQWIFPTCFFQSVSLWSVFKCIRNLIWGVKNWMRRTSWLERVVSTFNTDWRQLVCRVVVWRRHLSQLFLVGMIGQTCRPVVSKVASWRGWLTIPVLKSWLIYLEKPRKILLTIIPHSIPLRLKLAMMSSV